MQKNGIEVKTFGCRLNTYESEVMRGHASKAGLDEVIIFNTCAVTKEAERQGKQAIRRAKRDNPQAKIIVTGCSAQISPKLYQDMDEVTHVIGNAEKLAPATWSALENNDTILTDIMEVTETASHLVEGFEGQSRAFLQVQNGCDHRCTFCIIPYGRGNSRSVPIGQIVDQCRDLTEKGYAEIVFTGVDVTSYGADLPGQPSFGQMIRRVLAMVPELKRLRLSSLDPVEMDEDLWRLVAEEERLMPHLHMSLQAGDDMILKRMKRRHLRDDAINMARRAHDLRPDMAIGADIIAGFPTETEEMFLNTLRIIEECNIVYPHIFPYSEREGTPAARMPQVEKSLRKERAARLREAGDKQYKAFQRAQIGKKGEMLMEQHGIARMPNFAPVKIEGDIKPGTVFHGEITALDDGHHLAGKVA